jgi:hypothetical protein
MTNIQWDEDFVPAPKRSKRASIYEEFAHELVQRPFTWARWPREYANASSLYALATGINKGGDQNNIPGPFKTGKWEAAVQDNILRVRYLGE